MAKFNWQTLSWAKNEYNVSTEVGVAFIRKSWTDGEYVEIPSTSNVNINFDPTNIVEIKSESRGTLKKVKQDQANVTFDLAENAWLTFMSDILWITKTSTAAWAKTITDRAMTFADWVIEFKEISNDWLGVTSILVKHSVGGTAYELGTDYEIELIGNITRIKKLGAGIPVWATVYVSGSVNLNAQESAQFVADYATLSEFDLRVAFEKIVDWAPKYRIYDLDPVTLNSTYVLPFLNAVEAGGAQNTSLQFDLNEWGTIDIINELI